MKEFKLYRRKIQILCVLMMIFIAILSCKRNFNGPVQEVNGKLSINFEVHDFDHPIAIWLEDQQNNYIGTVFVSDWLSWSGYHYPTKICPNWNGVADWENVPKSTFDAVTSATPHIGNHQIIVDCKAHGLPHGNYNYLVESYITSNYNILFTGGIRIGNSADSSIAEVTYIPEIYPDSTQANVLSDVSAKYEALN